MEQQKTSFEQVVVNRLSAKIGQLHSQVAILETEKDELIGMLQRKDKELEELKAKESEDLPVPQDAKEEKPAKK